MECNKEQAERAMTLAEERFKENDVDGAMRMVLEAESLYPSLPGLHQMIAALEVHTAAAADRGNSCGDVYWLSVLGAEPSDDLETVKRRYKDLCLKLHPDRNPSVAAEAAFKLVGEAWAQICRKDADGTGGGSLKICRPTNGAPCGVSKTRGPNVHGDGITGILFTTDNVYFSTKTTRPVRRRHPTVNVDSAKPSIRDIASARPGSNGGINTNATRSAEGWIKRWWRKLCDLR